MPEISHCLLSADNSSSPPTVIATTTTSETARRERVIPIRLTSGFPSPNVNNNIKNDSSVPIVSSRQERVIPIQRETEQGRKNVRAATTHQFNGNHKENVEVSTPPTSRPGKNLNNRENMTNCKGIIFVLE